jgi:hypothetical protein
MRKLICCVALFVIIVLQLLFFTQMTINYNGKFATDSGIIGWLGVCCISPFFVLFICCLVAPKDDFKSGP